VGPSSNCFFVKADPRGQAQGSSRPTVPAVLYDRLTPEDTKVIPFYNFRQDLQGECVPMRFWRCHRSEATVCRRVCRQWKPIHRFTRSRGLWGCVPCV